MSDAERFCYGLGMLARECNLASVEHNLYGNIFFQFEDGSYMGGLTAYVEAGIIKKLN